MRPDYIAVSERVQHVNLSGVQIVQIAYFGDENRCLYDRLIDGHRESEPSKSDFR